ncbi:acetyltransferase (GNAT) family protein [Chromohalobacter marismortui]|uniref:Acetyltransferase (GNAT) family protein n=1 Tax=Chromohalobacter marismortui TaxID=42055 RepID=A0A4R7NNL1_9GAMM|nr:MULTISPECIES: GNAT family N-acetyltransferase [Chromohalobacter]MCI0509952.1 GNAT family N-acetyltransferase [Chromohalobacter sp.]MCI0593116.1 GNAT family N-acetyltransferase [Chromohalobacter sp.]TDU22149.1 acetyltransferase (GNAT) family protein [Chromohalobacter marismortui]
MAICLQPAQRQYLDELLFFVRAYHKCEGVQICDEVRRDAVISLLGNSAFGRIFLIRLDAELIGYVAISFGFSIEFGGRDAFIDEIFISAEYRGSGYGREALALMKAELARHDIKAIHLEVARTNKRAQQLYRSLGFSEREKYFLMSTEIFGVKG